MLCAIGYRSWVLPMRESKQVDGSAVELSFWRHGLVSLPTELGELPELVKLDLRWNTLAWSGSTRSAPWTAALLARGCRVML